MKKTINKTLALGFLISLTACGGQYQAPGGTYGYPQQNPYGQQNPYTQQNLYATPNYAQQGLNQLPDAQVAQYNAAPQQYSQSPTQVPDTYSSQRTSFSSSQKKSSQAPSQTRQTSTKKTVTRKAVTTRSKKTTLTARKPKLTAGQSLILKAKQRFESLKSLKIKVDAFESHKTKGPTTLTFNIATLNGRTKLEVTKHKNGMFVGAKMGYVGGVDQISVRPGGALGFVKLDSKMSDEKLLTPRGYQLDQIDAFAIAKRLLNGKHKPKVLGQTKVNGRSTAILEYTRANDFDSSITRELLGVDMKDHFVRIHEMYEGSKLVFSLKISNVQLNAPVTSKELDI